MDINREVARLREQLRIQAAQQAAADGEQAARMAAGQRAQVEQGRFAAANSRQLEALACKFIAWAEQSRITPSDVLTIHTSWMRWGRYHSHEQPVYGWRLETAEHTLHDSDPSPGRPCDTYIQHDLLILTTGMIGWSFKRFIQEKIIKLSHKMSWQRGSPQDPLTPDYVEARIAEFIANSGSRVPWPSY